MNSLSRAYELRKLLGCGTWGNVYLAAENGTSRLVALKVIRDVERVGKVERSMLERISNPFIIQSYGSFIAKQKMHICLEYVEGGDLAHQMSIRGSIPLQEARLYVAEIAIALRELHSNGIVYRDLKPENVMLGCNGYIKLCDFGLSAERSICSSVCGTYEYLAPEILSRKSYGPEVDWWALGILFFELLFKRTPFYAPDPDRMKDKILNRTLCVPDCGNSDVASLLYGLLDKNPEKRFGFDKLVNHPLFKDISFDELMELKVDPPFKPEKFVPGEIPPKAPLRMSRSRGSFGTGEGVIRSESMSSFCG
jgi:serine/threonine protein kinase